jgi:hypothetical protein
MIPLKKIFRGFLKTFLGGVFDDIKKEVDKTLEITEKRVEHITERVIKRTITFFIIITGLIFGLIGLSKYLTETVPSLKNGFGYIIVGIALLLLGWFANYLSKK